MREAESLLHQQADANRAVLSKAQIIRAEHVSLQQQLEESRQRLNRLEIRVPKDALESDFFGQVANLSKRQGVRIHGFRPISSAALNDYHSVRVAFDASGEYQTLCQFLDELARLPRLNHIAHLHVMPQSPQSSLLTVKIETEIYFTPGTASKGVRS
jgi:Tfp pilus assembly protein PilO